MQNIIACKKVKNDIDFTDLQCEVMDFWESEGIGFYIHENNGFNAPDPEMNEVFIKPDYEAILNDPMLCLNELGYDKISNYMADKADEETIEKEGQAVGYRKVNLGYSLISKTRTKFFFEMNGKEIEFCIDRDTKNSTAELWFKSVEDKRAAKMLLKAIAFAMT